jgi:gliding motility-associated-like protein
MKKVDMIFMKLLKEVFSLQKFVKKSPFIIRCIFPIFFCILFFSEFSQAQYSQKKNWTYKDPFNTNVFIENHGQFDKWVTDAGSIKYAINKGDKFFFTPQGYTVRVDRTVKKEESDLDENKSKIGTFFKSREEEEEMENTVLEKYTVHMNWIGCNINADMIVSDEASNYYTFGEKGYENIKAKGYKKLVYKDLYPNIDVEYTIPEKGGIKYKLILHPGADLSKVKMEYTGDVEDIIFDFDGNINVITLAGNIIDHAPLSYYEEGSTQIQSAFELNGKIVSFKLNGSNSNTTVDKTVVIDPWTITPTSLATDNAAYDIAYDDNGNVFVSGGTDPFKLSKYTAGGSLIWTYTVPAGWAQSYYSKFCIIPQSGSTLIGEGFNSAGTPNVMKIDPSGNLVLTATNLSGSYEIWVMFYNRCSGKLAGFGGGVQSPNNIQLMSDTNLTTSSCWDFNGYGSTDNDISATVEDLNGDFYALMSSQVLASNTGHLLKSLTSTGYTPPCAFDVNTGYDLYECANYGIPGFGGNCGTGATVRTNALAVNANYLFSYDGKTLNAWNKTNGASLGSIVVNGGYAGGQNRTHEGIAVDDCNNVYVGGTNQVHAFTYNGSTFTAAGSIPMSGEVYDIQIDRMTGILYVAGLGFVTTVQESIVCNVNQLTVTASATPGVCDGSASVTVSGGVAPYTYEWSNGATTSSILNVPPGWYYVTATDNSCIRLRGQDSVLISASFPTTISPAVTVCSGTQVQLQATGGVSYTWAPAGSLDNPNISNPIASPTSTTTYSVTISNGTCTKIDTVTVTIIPNAAISITALPNPICVGASTTLTAAGAATYTWSGGLGTANPLTVSPAATTTYTVTGSSGGCSGTASITVNVDPLPNPQISPFNDATCGLNNGSATATGGTNYIWSNGLNTATISGLSAGTYTVTVSNAGGCSSSVSVTINSIPPPVASATSTDENCGHANGTATVSVTDGTAPFSILWSNSQNTTTITNLPANTYTVTVTDADGCTTTASVTVANIAGPSLQVTNIINETCTYGNGSATVNAIGGLPPYNYLWSSGDNTATAMNLHAGTYTCTVTDANNCTAVNTAPVTDTPGPTPTLAGITDASCGVSDGSAMLNVSSGLPPYTFIWNSNPQQFGQNIVNVPTGNYCVTVTDANSCTATTCITIGEKNGPSATITSNNEICDMANGTATVNPTGGLGNYTYLWSDGQTTQTATGLVEGSYSVTVSDLGCSTSVSVNVLETPGPDAGFSAHPKILTIMDGTVSFLDNSSGNVVNWNWTYGDGSNGSGAETDHPYLNIGEFVVTLIITDNNGCLDTAVDTIKVKDIFTFYIPNAFTPNGDGYNDYFTPKGISVDPDEYEEYIFDRWGNVVFYTSKWNETLHQAAELWNGTTDNKGTYNDVVMDVYVYRIKLKEIDGPKHEYIGRISLIP